MPSIDLTPYYQPQGSTSDGTKYDNGLALIQSTLNAIDNNNVAAAAAIAASKLSGLATVLGTQVVSATNTDLQGPGASRSDLYIVTTGGGTLRSIAAPTENGSRVVVRNNSGSSITLKHQLVGGTGAQLYMRTVADVVLLDKELVEFVYDGTNWVEMGRDQASAAAGTAVGTELDYAQITTPNVAVTATTEGTAVVQIAGNSITYDGTRVRVSVFCPRLDQATASIATTFVLLRDTTVIGQVAFRPVGTPGWAVTAETFDTPTALAHVYKVAMFVASSNATFNAGAGTTGALVPAFLRVTKA